MTATASAGEDGGEDRDRAALAAARLLHVSVRELKRKLRRFADPPQGRWRDEDDDGSRGGDPQPDG